MDKTEKYRSKCERATRRMMKAQFKSGYWTAVAQYYAILCGAESGKSVDELVAEFREQIDGGIEIMPDEE